MRILDPHELPNNRIELDQYGEKELVSLVNFYGKEKKNKSDQNCTAILNGKVLFTEWRIVRNILYDYKEFYFVEAW